MMMNFFIPDRRFDEFAKLVSSFDWFDALYSEIVEYRGHWTNYLLYPEELKKSEYSQPISQEFFDTYMRNILNACKAKEPEEFLLKEITRVFTEIEDLHKAGGHLDNLLVRYVLGLFVNDPWKKLACFKSVIQEIGSSYAVSEKPKKIHILENMARIHGATVHINKEVNFVNAKNLIEGVDLSFSSEMYPLDIEMFRSVKLQIARATQPASDALTIFREAFKVPELVPREFRYYYLTQLVSSYELLQDHIVEQ
ncbi:MAG: hypothetical protein ABW148_17295 [Sedimenticola sp.]